jgi:hypothetical protein
MDGGEINERGILLGIAAGAAVGAAVTGFAYWLAESDPEEMSLFTRVLLGPGMLFAFSNAGVDDPDYKSQLLWLTISASLAINCVVCALIGAGIGMNVVRPKNSTQEQETKPADPPSHP